MKLSPELLEIIDTSVMARIEAVFCASDDAAVPVVASQLTESLGRRRSRKLRAASFAYSRRDSNSTSWKHRLLQDDDEDRICEDFVLNLDLEVGDDTMALTVSPEHLTQAYRPCVAAVVLDLAIQPETCFVGAYPEAVLFNLIASGIVQSGKAVRGNPSTPLHDLGLNGEGQVVALSDTGIDTDNCYFWDAKTSVKKQKSSSFDADIRKVVQYFSGVDGRDTTGGHGTHVAGTIAGRKAADGKKESNGEADGVAPGAKLAFYDIGNCTFGVAQADCVLLPQLFN